MCIPKIYLDNCTLNRPFDDQNQIKIRMETEAKLHIQTGIREKKYALCWSFMLDYENNNNPYDEKRGMISPWREIADDFCHPSDKVMSRVHIVMSRGIKHGDAIHIACAIEKHCDYFITTDKLLLKKTISGIKIVNPLDFVSILEDSR